MARALLIDHIAGIAGGVIRRSSKKTSTLQALALHIADNIKKRLTNLFND
jgi:hypothetical protein